MNNKSDMGFAEWLGRIILFPLSWLDGASARREQREQEQARQNQNRARKEAKAKRKKANSKTENRCNQLCNAIIAETNKSPELINQQLRHFWIGKHRVGVYELISQPDVTTSEDPESIRVQLPIYNKTKEAAVAGLQYWAGRRPETNWLIGSDRLMWFVKQFALNNTQVSDDLLRALVDRRLCLELSKYWKECWSHAEGKTHSKGNETVRGYWLELSKACQFIYSQITAEEASMARICQAMKSAEASGEQLTRLEAEKQFPVAAQITEIAVDQPDEEAKERERKRLEALENERKRKDEKLRQVREAIESKIREEVKLMASLPDEQEILQTIEAEYNTWISQNGGSL